MIRARSEKFQLCISIETLIARAVFFTLVPLIINSLFVRRKCVIIVLISFVGKYDRDNLDKRRTSIQTDHIQSIVKLSNFSDWFSKNYHLSTYVNRFILIVIPQLISHWQFLRYFLSQLNNNVHSWRMWGDSRALWFHDFILHSRVWFRCLCYG